MVTGLPRRLRIYPDVSRTAPLAHERLEPSVRRRLAALDAVRRLTAGWVALPALVDAKMVGASRHSVSLGRIVVLDREDRPVAEREPASVVELVEPGAVWNRLEAIVASDLRWVASNGPDWAAAATDTRTLQLDILRRAVIASGSRLSVVSVPAEWTAEHAISTLARHLGLEP
jgi:hypothetical protein